MHQKTKPYIINLEKIPGKGGDLSFIDEELPFVIQRVFWVYNVEKKVKRGYHAHKNSKKCIICLHKSVQVKILNNNGKEYTFDLNDPTQVLFFPPMHWIELTFEKNATIVVLASSTYEEDQLISDKNSLLN
ncbi:MAG: FdtA/QdtA family cupin domain-containing protein [Fulvivirga sp.]|nr:FdtA/QdtA family cupin domain-containing protein [Fulvivirga sp.]